MAQQWCTKEDVLKDLEVASGCRVADVEDGYFLYGKQPPPPRAVDNEDDEIELRFGRAASQGLCQEELVPDLIGITTMLRMVQKYETSDEEPTITPNKKVIITKANISKQHTEKIMTDGRPSSTAGKTASDNKLLSKKSSPAKTSVKSSGDQISCNNGLCSSKETNPTIIVTNNGPIISTLNPYVQEFIPKNMQIESVERSKSTNGMFNATSVTNAQSDNAVKISNEKSENEIPYSKVTKDAATNKDGFFPYFEQKEEKKQLAKMLKNQISTKNYTFEEQELNNRAIIKLLKLYTEPPKPIKLLTPQYFEKCIATDFKANFEESNKTDHSLERLGSLHNVRKVDDDLTSHKPLIAENNEAKSTFGQTENTDITDNVNFGEKDIDTGIENNDSNHEYYGNKTDIENYNIETETEDNKLETTHVTPYIHDDTSIEENIEIQNSITKVKNWLDDKSVATVSEKPKSPKPYLGAIAYKRKDTRICKSPIEVTEIKASEYRPSRYAEELHEKYRKRSMMTTPTAKFNIWEKLEADLKKKDIEFKNKEVNA